MSGFVKFGECLVAKELLAALCGFNQLSNITIWWLDICCLLHRYQLHVSALMAIFRLID